MRHIYLVFFLIASLAFMFSCDKIDAPYMIIEPIDTTITTIIDTTTYVQKVLIEDFTGHKCTNCPGASAKLEEIIDLYGNKIVPMALHVSPYAEPDPPNYPEDFRTTEGTAIDNFFGISAIGLPLGMINRKGYPNSHFILHTAWLTEAANVLQNNPTIGIKISNTYNQTTRKVDIKIKTTFFNDFNENLKLVVMITEDSIIAPQLVDNVLTSNYEHNHMLRQTVTNTWQGDLIVTGSVLKDVVLTKDYTLIDIDPTWKENYCNIVAYVYYESSYEVINAEFEPVIK